MDLVGRERRRGLVGEPLTVERRAVRQRPDTRRLLRRLGQILLLPRNQIPVGRAERSRQRRSGVVLQGLGLRGVEAALLLEVGNLALEVSPDGAVGGALVERRAGDDLRGLVDDEVEGKPRRP